MAHWRLVTPRLVEAVARGGRRALRLDGRRRGADPRAGGARRHRRDHERPAPVRRLSRPAAAAAVGPAAAARPRRPAPPCGMTAPMPASVEEPVSLLEAVPAFRQLGARTSSGRRGGRAAALRRRRGGLPRGRRLATRATSSAPATRARCASTPTAARSRSPRSARATSSASWRCSTTSAARRRSRRSTTLEALAILGPDMRRLMREHADDRGQARGLARAPAARGQRAARAASPSRPCRAAWRPCSPSSSSRRSAEGAGAARRADHRHPGRPREARRLLARVGAAASSPCSSGQA